MAVSIGGESISFLGYNTPLLIGQSYSTIYTVVSNYESLSFTFKADQATTVNAYWKNTPADPDVVLAFTSTYDPAVDPGGIILNTAVKGVYFSYTLENTSGVDQTSLSCSCYGSTSPNISPPTIVPTLTTDASENLQITFPDPTTTLITVGDKHGTTSMYIDNVAPRVGDAAVTESTYVGEKAGLGSGGASTRYNQCTCVGVESSTDGTEGCAYGRRSQAGNRGVALGGLAKTNFAESVAVGYSAQTVTNSRGVTVGAYSRAGLGATSVGYRCGGTGGTSRDYSVMFGHDCANVGANGRLGFGSSMEAVQTTATAGAQTLPANPAGFLRIEWNGTLYKLPIYND